MRAWRIPPHGPLEVHVKPDDEDSLAFLQRLVGGLISPLEGLELDGQEWTSYVNEDIPTPAELNHAATDYFLPEWRGHPFYGPWVISKLDRRGLDVPTVDVGELIDMPPRLRLVLKEAGRLP